MGKEKPTNMCMITGCETNGKYLDHPQIKPSKPSQTSQTNSHTLTRAVTISGI